MSGLALFGDMIAVVGFMTAMLITVLTPSDDNDVFDARTKWLMLGAFATRAYVSATKVLVFYRGPSVFEDFGD